MYRIVKISPSPPSGILGGGGSRKLSQIRLDRLRIFLREKSRIKSDFYKIFI